MSDVLSEQDCMPNLNAATIAGKVIKVEPLTGKTPGLSFVVGYQKRWPHGGMQEIPLKCYVTGAERIEKLGWLKPGETILAHGQLTDQGALYAYRLEWVSKPEQQPGEGDRYLAGMEQS